MKGAPEIANRNSRIFEVGLVTQTITGRGDGREKSEIVAAENPLPPPCGTNSERVRKPPFGVTFPHRPSVQRRFSEAAFAGVHRSLGFGQHGFVWLAGGLSPPFPFSALCLFLFPLAQEQRDGESGEKEGEK
jgi:hypothetical protein